MSRIIVVNAWERMANVIKNQLKALFGDLIEVGSASLERGIDAIIEADIVLIATTKSSGSISKYIAENANVLLMKRTISRTGWDKIMSIAPQTKVLLVNDMQESTYETIALLYELGASHLELIPYYPGIEEFEYPKIAITPNEVDLVPAKVERVINIGDRVLDAYTIIDILSKLDLFHNKIARELFVKCLEETIPRNSKLFGSLSAIMESKQHLELVLEVVDEGIIAYDDTEKIIIFNKFAEKIFQNPSWKVKDSLLKRCFSTSLEKIYTESEIKDATFTINGNKYIVNKYPLLLKGQFIGGVIRLKEYTEIERLEQKIREEAKSRGYVAKYTFESIIGNSQALQSACALAVKMAKCDNTVLIEGESGTGKELFAQAIHNASLRRNHPFVAFNCAAVPDTLIESELFGYEAGAFTGAKRSGKPGLFELAHSGTIFLDEIGDISKNMQAKLLRVLQEKECVRVGGNVVKLIDVRVITATNKNLLQLVEQGHFRKDLYYRINVLLLRLPSLKERQSDILCLIKHFLSKYGMNRIISEQCLAALQSYPWSGNVRELENCVDYLVSMSDSRCIGLTDLPVNILDYIHRQAEPEVNAVALTKPDNSETYFILKIIDEAEQSATKIGRGRITEKLREFQIHLTEQEVRGRLKKLSVAQYVYIGKGRAGTKLTTKGKLMLQQKN